MKRQFIKRPVLASKSFWSTDIESFEGVKAEIQKALDAGCTFEDVDDYLNELYNLEIIDDEQFSELMNWAAPYTSNGDVYASSDALPRLCKNCASRYDSSGHGMCYKYEFADCEDLPDPAATCEYYKEDPKCRPEYEEDMWDDSDRPYRPSYRDTLQ